MIGDRIFRDLAHAALAPFLDKAGAQKAVAELARRFTGPSPTTEKSLVPLEALTLVLTAKFLSDADRAKRLEQAVALARERIAEASERAVILGVLASHLPFEQRKGLLNEAMELAKAQDGDNRVPCAFLATFFPGAEAELLMQHAQAAKGQGSADAEPDAGERATEALIRLLAPLALEASLPAMQAGVAAVLGEVFKLPKHEGRTATLAVALLLSPKFPHAEGEALVQKIFDEVRTDDDEWLRAILLMMLAPYLPTELLRGCINELLAIGQRAPRPTLLAALALAQGLAGELWNTNPHIAGNRIPGSPLARLGGDSAVAETDEAIRDVCNWWT